MKIEGNSPTPEAANPYRVDQARSDRTGKSDRDASPGTDRVDLSADAQLVRRAMRAAEGAPAIRRDLVEQMRQRLAAGKVGNDSARLADRLIDHLLGK